MLRYFFLLVVSLLFSCATTFAQHRVVSLSPIASKAIDVLGASDQVVGCTKWCPFADEKEIVANAIDVNIEQVFRLSPDVVFTSTLTNQENINTLKQLGVLVVELPRTTSFDMMCEELLLISSYLGKEEKAKHEIKIAKENLAIAKKRIIKGKSPKVVFQVGSKPVFVAIPNTFVDDYIIQAGAINVFDDITHGSVSRESVVRRNPDAIFISTMPAAASHDEQQWLTFNEMSAVQLGNIMYIDQNKASSPTIHTFVEVVELMIDVLY